MAKNLIKGNTEEIGVKTEGTILDLDVGNVKIGDTFTISWFYYLLSTREFLPAPNSVYAVLIDELGNNISDIRYIDSDIPASDNEYICLTINSNSNSCKLKLYNNFVITYIYHVMLVEGYEPAEWEQWKPDPTYSLMFGNSKISEIIQQETNITKIYRGLDLIWQCQLSQLQIPLTLYWNYVNKYVVNNVQYLPEYNGTPSQISWEVQTGTWNESVETGAVDGKMFTCVSPGTNKMTRIKCKFKGVSSITFSFRSDAESTYDYLIVSKLDTSLSSITSWAASSVYNNTNVQAYTRGSQGVWKTVTYDIMGENKEEHFVEFMFGKDGSTDTQPDNAKVYISDYTATKAETTQLEFKSGTEINWSCEVEDGLNDYITKNGNFILKEPTEINPFKDMNNFPSYVDETSNFIYVKDGEYLIMKDGEVVGTNMNLNLIKISSNIDNYLKSYSGRVLTSKESPIQICADILWTQQISDYGEDDSLEFVGFQSNTLNNTVITNIPVLKLKHFKGEGFWGSSKFKNNTVLKKVICPYISPSVSCANMFENCTSLKEVYNMPDPFNSAHSSMFRECTNLEYINPVNYTQSGTYTFCNCYNLKIFPIKEEMYVSNTPHSLERIATNVEGGIEIPNKISILGGNSSYVLNFANVKGKLDIVTSLSGWGAFKETKLEEINLHINNVGSNYTGSCFYNNPNLRKVTINDISAWTSTSTSFFDNDFGGCSNLQYINIPGINYSSIIKDPKFSATQWGVGSEENRRSLVDTLLTNSVNIAANGKTANVILNATTMNLLTDEEKAAITAKGFTLIQG